MAKVDRWLSPKQVCNRWNLDKSALANLLEQGLPAFFLDNKEKFDIEQEKHEGAGSINFAFYLELMVFKFSDIKSFEQENDWLTGADDQMELSGKDARLLGQLKREKENWDNSLAVAVQVGIFCAQEEERMFKRNEIYDFAYSADNNISKATIEKIWKAIPVKFRKGAGAPQKK